VKQVIKSFFKKWSPKCWRSLVLKNASATYFDPVINSSEKARANWFKK